MDKGSNYIISSGKVSLYTSHLEVVIEKNDNAPGYVSFKPVLPAGSGASAHTNWCSVLDLETHDILELMKSMIKKKATEAKKLSPLGKLRRIMQDDWPLNNSSKHEYHRVAKLALIDLANTLEIPKFDHQIKSDIRNDSYFGDITLHSTHFHIVISKDFDGKPVRFRTCDARNDHTGHKNHWCTIEDLYNEKVSGSDRAALEENIATSPTIYTMKRLIKNAMNPLKQIVTTHPKNNSNVVVTYDDKKLLIKATYKDNGEEIEMTDAIKLHLQHDIDSFAI